MNTHDKIELPPLPEGWETELLDWVSACQSAYHIDNTPGHRFGGLGSNLEENRLEIVCFVRGLIESQATTLQSQDREDAFCVWRNDPETDNSWDTSCRQLFEIYDGTPTENGMTFCCYCGKPIREAIDHARRIEGEG